VIADPAIEEIRAVRHRISEDHGHDTRTLLDHYRQLEADYQDRLVTGRGRQAGSKPGSGSDQGGR
jgi:hypothetical protein